ncbi:MAG: hypothetical protein JXA00_01725 [Candidatus Thermoplasmatota archaeon]|nr:hypothetical protein [Candidatus Thermoplasmatota archaeon]
MKWIDLGDNSIFLPNITGQVEVNISVLSWGLGLERLAMLRYGLTDIRSLYISDIDWLRKTPLL